MFYFVVRYFRWLARVPGFPHLFDAMLLSHTFLFRRKVVTAMEKLESEELRLPGTSLRVHRLGGIEFINEAGRELGHLHGHGLLDVALDRATGRSLLAAGRVREHHVFPDSRWVSFQIESELDVAFALELLKMANDRMEQTALAGRQSSAAALNPCMPRACGGSEID